MAKYRIGFTKETAVQYISHLDLLKLFQRAIRRAALPIAYSEGFNPHPKMSFASALKLGVTSEDEMLDLELTCEIDPLQLVDQLQEEMPVGIRIKRAEMIPDLAPSGMAVVNAAEYMITFCDASCNLKHIWDSLWERSEILVLRNTKHGDRWVNIRPLVFSGAIESHDQHTVLRLVVHMGADGTGRPEELVEILKQEGFQCSETETNIHRTRLLHIGEDGVIRTPWEITSKEMLRFFSSDGV